MPDNPPPLSHEARIKLEEKSSEDASPDAINQSEAEKLEKLAPAAGQAAGSKADPLLDIRPLLEQ
ncbi:hypothetical protein GC177_06520 [bacterium]|nr:hypothetical protein [bacterium]